MEDDRKWKQLLDLYGEKDDDELLELNGKRGDLTELAQQALAEVIRERKLDTAGQAKDAEPEAAVTMLGERDVLVYEFRDAMQAREAIRQLTIAEVEHRMLDWREIEPGAEFDPRKPSLGLVVDRADVSRARAVLHDTLGLFPSAEGDEATGPVGAAEDMVLLSMFDVEGAMLAADTLARARISYYWRDGKDEPENLPDEETVAIEVRAENLERATALVQERLDAEVAE